MIKEIFDRLCSFFLIVLLLPLLVLIAIGIVATSGFPIFFKQERIGQYGRVFSIIKFRTMSGKAKFSVAAMEQNRITRFGRFLRKTKLDELPELLNILKGDMSFVGPRPDVAGYADKLEGDDRVVLRLKPGLTGVASLKYHNENLLLAQQSNPKEYNDNVIWPDKVRLNKLYAEKQTFWLDLKILLYTALCKNVEGFE